MKLHTLTRIRRATRQKDGTEGILYVHQWPTGFQELVFRTEVQADRFLAHLNSEPEAPAEPATPEA